MVPYMCFSADATLVHVALFSSSPRKLAETDEEKKQLESIDKLCEFKEGPLFTIARKC